LSFSYRTKLLGPPAIRKMRELSEKMENVIHLEQGEPDFRTPSHIIEAAKAAMDKGFTHYSSVSGMLELREAIADKLNRENGISVDPGQVTITSGTQEAMIVAALTLLNPGDEALILDPYYPSYVEDTLLAEAIPVPVPLNEERDFQIDLQTLESKITTKSKMIWLCNPSNPTGHVFTKGELETLAEVAQKHDLFVFADEIYEKLVYDGARHVSVASLPDMGNRTITVNGFSKAYAMTGWRIGYFAAEKKTSAQLSRIHYCATMCANEISQRAALVALRGPQDCVREMVAEYDRRRKTIFAGLNRIEGAHYTVPKGAFYVFPKFSNSKLSDEELAVYLLEKAGVVTVPGSGFGKTGEQHLRISYSVQHGQVEDAMKRIRLALEQGV